MTDPKAIAEAVAGRIRRYGDSKRGPHVLRYFTSLDGHLRIEASAPGYSTMTELAPGELSDASGKILPEHIARACEAIEKVLAWLRDVLAKVRVDG